MKKVIAAALAVTLCTVIAVTTVSSENENYAEIDKSKAKPPSQNGNGTNFLA